MGVVNRLRIEISRSQLRILVAHEIQGNVERTAIVHILELCQGYLQYSF